MNNLTQVNYYKKSIESVFNMFDEIDTYYSNLISQEREAENNTSNKQITQYASESGILKQEMTNFIKKFFHIHKQNLTEKEKTDFINKYGTFDPNKGIYLVLKMLDKN